MRDWVAEEEGAGAALRELRRLFTRALRRPVKPIVIALLAALGVAGLRARKVRVYESRVVYRVSEGDLDPTTSPAAAKQLRSYILDVVFSSQRLLGVMEELDLYARERRKGPDFAVETMRDDFEVDVWRNYFIEDRRAEEAGRSARIGISYRHPDRQVAFDVVRRLGRLVEEQEQRSRIHLADEAVERASAAVAVARDDLARRRGMITAKEMAARRAGPAQRAMLLMDVDALRKGLGDVEARLHDLERKKAALELRASMERNHLGMRFELVDPGHLAPPGISRPKELVILGIVTFLFMLPLGAMWAGAFDGRIYDAEDVHRLGLRLIGRLEPFPGDNVGSLEARLARDRRVQ